MSAAVLAQAPASCPPIQSPLPLMLVLSGGTSLGAYQAGFLNYLSEYEYINSNAFKVRGLTGASAGALNSFLYLLKTCASTQSLQPNAFKTWLDIDVDSLLAQAPEAKSLPAALSRQGLEKQMAAHLKPLYTHGLRPSCDLVLGMPLARLHPELLSYAGGGSIPKINDHVVVRVLGRGPNRSALITPYVSISETRSETLLPWSSTDAESDFELWQKLLYAATALPPLFLPQSLPICQTSTERIGQNLGPPQCPKESTQLVEYIDGGLFDNIPLPLAVNTIQRGFRRQCYQSGEWQPWLAPEVLPPMDQAPHIVMVIDAIHDPTVAIDYQSDNLTALIQNIWQASRSQKLVEFLESPTSKSKTEVTIAQSWVPRYGQLLGGAFGFIEREFRIFDFAVGMWMGEIQIEALTQNTYIDGMRPAFLRQTSNPSWDTHAGDTEEWQLMRCLRAIWHTGVLENPACSAVNRQYIKLWHVNMEWLWNSCHGHFNSQANQKPVCSDYLLSQLDRYGRINPIVSNKPNEKTLNFVMRRLDQLDFKFHNLQKNSSLSPQQNLRALTQVALERLTQSNAAPALGGRLISAATTYITHTPPPDRFFVVLGNQLELAYRSSGRHSWLRSQKGLGIVAQGFETWLESTQAPDFAGTLYISLDWQTANQQSAWQFDISSRTGYHIAFPSPRFQNCARDSRPNFLNCSGFTTGLSFGFEWLPGYRAQLGLDVLPVVGASPLWQGFYGLGIQF